MVGYKRTLSLVILMMVVSLFLGCAGKDVKKTVDIYANVNTMIVASAKVTKELCVSNTISADKCDVIAQTYDQYVKVDHAFNDGTVAYLEALKLRKSVDGQKKLEQLAEVKIKEAINKFDETQKNRALIMAELVKLFLDAGTWKGGAQ